VVVKGNSCRRYC